MTRFRNILNICGNFALFIVGLVLPLFVSVSILIKIYFPNPECAHEPWFNYNFFIMILAYSYIMYFAIFPFAIIIDRCFNERAGTCTLKICFIIFGIFSIIWFVVGILSMINTSAACLNASFSPIFIMCCETCLMTILIVMFFCFYTDYEGISSQCCTEPESESINDDI